QYVNFFDISPCEYGLSGPVHRSIRRAVPSSSEFSTTTILRRRAGARARRDRETPGEPPCAWGRQRSPRSRPRPSGGQPRSRGRRDGRGSQIDDERAAGAARRAVDGDEPVEVLTGREDDPKTLGRAKPLLERGLKVGLGEHRTAVLASVRDPGSFEQQDVDI